MSFRRAARWMFLLAVPFLAAACSRRAEGERLGREFAEYMAPQAGAKQHEDLAAYFARGYVDRLQKGQVMIYNSAIYVPPEGANWSEENKLAYWRGYMRAGSVLVEAQAARERRATVVLQAAGLTALVALPCWWLWRRGRRRSGEAR